MRCLFLVEMGRCSEYNRFVGIKEFFKSSLRDKVGAVLGTAGNRDEIIEELEEALILADVSYDLVQKILTGFRKRLKFNASRIDIMQALKDEIRQLFGGIESGSALPDHERAIFLLVGINGSGKTTSAAKLAHYFKQNGKSVLLGAADTFRAAGSSQLALWGERLNIPVIGGQRGSDPGAVVYNSLNSYGSKGYDYLIIDTAGRVQTRENLMKELEKLTKIIGKFFPDLPLEIFLIVDATMGQNTLDQAMKFREFTGMTGLILAKLDGSAKGGTILNIMDEMEIPVRFAGTGERESDLFPFSRDEFLDALVGE